MSQRKLLTLVSYGCIALGIGLLLAVGGYVYSDFRAWQAMQSHTAAAGLPPAQAGPAAPVLAAPEPAMPVGTTSPQAAQPPALYPPVTPASARVFMPAVAAAHALARPASGAANAGAGTLGAASAAAATAPTPRAIVNPTAAAGSPQAAPDPGVPVLLSIPSLGIERTIIPVHLAMRNGSRDWDTDPLFATRQHPDFVGHLEGSANLGQPGNTVLAGHNYNRGLFNWLGVFYTLNRLATGDMVYVTDDHNVRYAYRVVAVEKVNYPPRSAADSYKHFALLGPTPDETLTLMTCGGANFAPFPSRFYVTAKRVAGTG